MFRTTVFAALGAALLSSTALAQPADDRAPNAPPAQLSAPDSARDYSADRQAQARDDQRSRDLFCRRDAAARTGYVSPGQAASHEQAAGSIGGTVLGAAAGAAIGSASHNAGPGALIGAGVGLLAGTAIGQDNARHAASDVERAYADAYYACMDEADAAPPADYPAQYAEGPPPPYGYGYYGPPPPAYYDYPPYPAYYGPGLSFGFRFGGGRHDGFHGGRFHHR